MSKRKMKEIVTGSLYCSSCKQRYSIEDTTPDLLPQSQKSDRKHLNKPFVRQPDGAAGEAGGLRAGIRVIAITLFCCR